MTQDGGGWKTDGYAALTALWLPLIPLSSTSGLHGESDFAATFSHDGPLKYQLNDLLFFAPKPQPVYDCPKNGSSAQDGQLLDTPLQNYYIRVKIKETQKKEEKRKKVTT